MKIILRYQNTSYTLDFNTVPSISQLKKEISKKTQVDTKFQKIIFKGKVISNQSSKVKLSNLDIPEGARLFLISTFQNKDPNLIQTTRRQPKIPPFDLKDQPLNQDIVNLGPPPGCENGLKNTISKFPKNPFIIYDTKGNISQMAIEQDSLWIYQIVEEGIKGSQDRIFYSDITDHRISDIEKYKNQYCAIILKVKKIDSDFDIKIFYFIPYQYSETFKRFLKERTA